MTKKLLVYCFLTLVVVHINAQDFNVQQQAWLYKIVRKTPGLKRNLDTYFHYTGGIPEKGKIPGVGRQSRLSGEVSLWDSIENNILLKPEVLTVDWEGMQKVSPGVLAELSLKLTLWELYSNIKDGYNQDPMFSGNDIVKNIYGEMVKALPAIMRSGNFLKKKYQPIFLDLINPSLNIGRKLGAFSKVRKVDASAKKVFFDKWHNIINAHVEKYSNHYFNVLCGKETYLKGELLAVGEGSGSSGLLREYEDREGGYMATGTGKGIGLFTYNMKIKKDKLWPDSHTLTSVKSLADEPTLLHLSLWGMDWSKKPLVVISNGEKSYLLFGSGEFSPDPERGEGTSYLDRIEEYRQRMITKPIGDLNKEGGLLSIYEREQFTRDKIQQQIDRNNQEIDSLKKLAEINEVAISQRLKRNEVNLNNLTDKEIRLVDLQRKISAVYSKIDRAEKELEEMKLALGSYVQNWVKKDSIYTFEDGTVFNWYTQDLILYRDSLMEENIEVKLLAASYSVYSEKKDEVQLYVNVTGGAKNELLEEKNVAEPDTLIESSIYFEPDEFVVDSLRKSYQKLLVGLDKEKEIELNLWAMGVDTLNHPHIYSDKKNYTRNKNLKRYKDSRRVELRLIELEEKYIVEVRGYTDAGNTKLSKVSNGVQEGFQGFLTDEQTLNPILSLLRVYHLVKEIARIANRNFSDQSVYIVPLKKKIRIGDLDQYGI